MTVRTRPDQAHPPDPGLHLSARLSEVVRTPSLRATDTFAQACGTALGASLRQIVATTEALRQDAAGPEAVHQLHVALTRFRSTVRLFGLQHHDPRWRATSQQARALAKAVGKARDLEVFCTGALQSVCQAHPGDRALQTFAALARRAQTRAKNDCRQALCAPQATRFAFEALRLIEGLAAPQGVGTDAAANTGSELQWHAPAAPFLQGRLQALSARLYRRLAHAHSARSWHIARLAAKALRYALALALPMLAHRRRRARVLNSLLRLQQSLGQVHDQAMARKLARRLASASKSRTTARALALVEAWCVRPGQARLPSHAQVQKIKSQLGKMAKKPPALGDKGSEVIAIDCRKC
jgi:CHAD domain-containing protein